MLVIRLILCFPQLFVFLAARVGRSLCNLFSSLGLVGSLIPRYSDTSIPLYLDSPMFFRCCSRCCLAVAETLI